MIGVLAAALVLSIDQLSKYMVLKLLVGGRTVRVGPILRMRVAANPIRDESKRRWIGQSILLFLIIAFVVYLEVVVHLFQNDLAQAGLGAAFGGAVSNVFDRFFRLRVIDFIDFTFWPAFNFADLAIVLGLALALLHVR